MEQSVDSLDVGLFERRLSTTANALVIITLLTMAMSFEKAYFFVLPKY